jgi:thiol-disulfide isomerase/thioredoxin
MLWSGANSIAQNRTVNIRPLTVGDTLPPDLILENVTNYPVSKIRLSKLNKKLIVLDFVATWCASCLKELPRLDSLQKTFAKEVAIFLISNEPKERLLDLNKRFKALSKLTMPMVYADSFLSKMFQHKIIPHKVWIDHNGKVIAITESKYLTKENIQKLLSDSVYDLPVKKDFIEFDAKKPLTATLAELQQNSTKLCYGVFGNSLPGVSGRSTVDKSNDSVRILHINQTLDVLYQSALGLSILDRESVILDLAKSEYDKSSESESYCYEIVMPKTISIPDIKKLMLQDLNEYFGLEVVSILKEGRIAYKVRPKTNQLN